MAAEQSGRTIEEVLSSGEVRPVGDEPGQTIEDVLSRGQTDLEAARQGVTPEQLASGTSGRKNERNMLLQGALAGALSIPGGMAGRAFLGPLLTRPVGAAVGEALGSGGGTLLGGGSPRDAAVNAAFGGGAGLVGEAIPNMLARGTARLAHVPKPAVEPVMAAGPVKGAQLTRFPQWAVGAPPPEAEHGIASGLADSLQGELAGRPGSKPLAGMREATEALQRPGEVDSAPIRSKLESMLRQPIGGKMPTQGEEIANEAINDLLDNRLPEKFDSVAQMHEWLQRIRQPIEQNLGRPVTSLTGNDLKELQSFVRQYRDTLLGGPESPGAKGFAAATKRMDDIEKVLPMLVDKEGNLTPTAEKVVTRTGNAETMKRLRAVDPATADAIERLATQRAWSNDTRIGVGRWMLERLLARPVAKTAAFVTRPTGHAAAATGAFLSAMQRGRDKTLQEVP